MEDLQMPECIFAAGEESNRERAYAYHKPKRIEALDPEEVEFLCNTMFGKIISQTENSYFSGSFGQFVFRYLLLQQLFSPFLAIVNQIFISALISLMNPFLHSYS
ncbi:hypothetical protein Bca4012_060805 [Brassica carinata]|uniref:Uncharacterized protein n=1 Tax=Brassica carinata TaxID=52824 RepID=A0A8X7S9M2_BRACI|nr:hypothetical protein Bca52824_031161 [Brassica carinata]